MAHSGVLVGNFAPSLYDNCFLLVVDDDDSGEEVEDREEEAAVVVLVSLNGKNTNNQKTNLTNIDRLIHTF